MSRYNRPPVPPFVEIGSTVFIVVNWDPNLEDADEPLRLKMLPWHESEMYRSLIREAQEEAFAAISVRPGFRVEDD